MAHFELADLDLHFLPFDGQFFCGNFADINFVVCFLEVLMLILCLLPLRT